MNAALCCVLRNYEASHRVQSDCWLADARQNRLDKLDIGARHGIAG
jgi:hypothetical protein